MVTDAQTTVYNKGAEVIRLYETILGKDGFRKGMDLYFERHDGQAVTCDDFMAAMSDANGKDLSSLYLWYSQAGTPTLTIEYSYDSSTGSFIITLSQTFPPSSGPVLPCLIPCRTALFGPDGSHLPLFLDGVPVGNECVLELDQWAKSFCFTKVPLQPVPSFLRGFSAPVNCVIVGQSNADLQFLLSHDTDGFNRNEVLFHIVMPHHTRIISIPCRRVDCLSHAALSDFIPQPWTRLFLQTLNYGWMPHVLHAAASLMPFAQFWPISVWMQPPKLLPYHCPQPASLYL